MMVGISDIFCNVAVLICVCASLSTVSTLKPVDHQECHSWDNLAQDLYKQYPANCSRNSLCTGISCIGTYQGKGFRAGMELFPCEQPVKLLLFANSDAFNLHNFSRNFTDKESIKIQGLSINFGPPFGKVEGFITTDLQRNQNVVALTLTVRGHVVGSPLPIGEWPDALTTELISNYEFAIPNCPIPVPGAVTLPNSVQDIEQFVESEINEQEKSSGTQTFNNCTRGFLGQCRVKETCVLKPDSREGLCQCELGYKLDRVGQCTRKESGQSTIGPTNVAPTVSHNSSSSSTSAPKSFEEKKTTITAVVGAVGTCALLGVIAAVFVVLRRRRAQANQAYTMVANFSDDDDAQLIGQNEELA